MPRIPNCHISNMQALTMMLKILKIFMKWSIRTSGQSLGLWSHIFFCMLGHKIREEAIPKINPLTISNRLLSDDSLYNSLWQQNIWLSLTLPTKHWRQWHSQSEFLRLGCHVCRGHLGPSVLFGKRTLQGRRSYSDAFPHFNFGQQKPHICDITRDTIALGTRPHWQEKAITNRIRLF